MSVARAPSAKPAPTARRHLARAFAAALPFLALLLPQVSRAVDEVRFFRIGTAATTGTYFQIGGVLASALSKPPGTRDCEHGGSCGVTGLVVVAQATQGSVENLLAIGAGRLESGFAQSDVAHWAYAGDAPAASTRCRGKPADSAAHDAGLDLLKSRGAMPSLRFIASLFAEEVQIVVPASSPIRAVKDLKGKRVGMGEPGSGTIIDARLVLEAAGLGECDVKPQYLRLAPAAEALQSGALDALFIVAGAPVPAIAEIASLIPVRLVPIEGAALDRLMGRPPFFKPETIAGGTYPGIDAPVQTVGVGALWVVDGGLPADLVYAVTRALWQDTTRRLLDFAHPAGRKIRLATALGDAPLPLHPGAARYYAERGLELPPQR